MAMNLKFLSGSLAGYNALAPKTDGVFYYATDEHRLFIGEKELTNEEDLKKYVTLETFNALKTLVGEGKLDTTAQNVVEAINEVLTKLEAAETAETVTVEDTTSGKDLHKQYTVKQGDAAVGATIDIDKVTLTSTGGESEAKVYTLKQGEREIGHIDIPKDLVVQSGEVVEDPEHGGTCIKLVLNSGTELFIPAKDLVDVYKASDEPTAITLTFDTDEKGNHTIKAQINNGGVTADMLATDVIKDWVLKEELDTLITEGSVEGAIEVNETSVKVHGLGSAAYKDENAFDVAGAATAAADAAKTEAVSTANSYTDTAKTNAIETAKSYADGLWVWGTYPEPEE